MGLVVGKGLMTAVVAGMIGGFATGFGSLTFGKRVMKTVGKKITQLNAAMAFAAQFGAAVAVYILTLLAIPTSITFAIIGAVAGVGLVKGSNAIEKSTIKKILFGWFLTPVIGIILAPIILYIVRMII
jgi:PiT family inorganic phosphate transporter